MQYPYDKHVEQAMNDFGRRIHTAAQPSKSNDRRTDLFSSPFSSESTCNETYALSCCAA